MIAKIIGCCRESPEKVSGYKKSDVYSTIAVLTKTRYFLADNSLTLVPGEVGKCYKVVTELVFWTTEMYYLKKGCKQYQLTGNFIYYISDHQQ